MLSNTHPEASPEAAVHPEPDVSAETLSARTVLSDKRGVSTSVIESLGAVGLGILLMVSMAFAVGAGLNYGHDSSAKSTLDAVKTAEVLHKAKTGSYGDKEMLTTGNDAALTKSDDDLMIAANDKNYCAAMESGSMFSPSYWVTAKSGEMLEEKPTEAEAGIACPDPEAG